MDELNLTKEYSKPVVKHIEEFIKSAVSKGYAGKTTDMAEFSENHRTTKSHFLSEGKWDEKYLDGVIKSKATSHIESIAVKENKPVFVSVDDTVNCKKKPSSQAKSPIEETHFHHSHLLGKRVCGHQVISTMLSSGDSALNYDMHRYDKTKQTKIDYVMEMAQSLPVPKTKGYALFDSWFTCAKVINSFEKQGYYCIGALKTNRIIYPQGMRISISDFAAKYIEMNDVSLVTVNSKDYYVYRYEGSLSGIANAVILISWPVDAFKNPKALKAFISTDVSLDTTTILEYYAQRWCIEIFFKQEKVNLGFDKYQIRSIKGIERFWLLTSLVHLFCCVGLPKPMKFGEGLIFVRNLIKSDIIHAIFDYAQKGAPVDDVICALIS